LEPDLKAFREEVLLERMKNWGQGFLRGQLPTELFCVDLLMIILYFAPHVKPVRFVLKRHFRIDPG